MEAAVKSGRVSRVRLDASVRRMLEIKARLGLFRRRTVNLDSLPYVVGRRSHRDTALAVSARSLVLVRDTPWYGQPSSDGSFSLGPVPPGNYTLHAWHERASELTLPLEVPAEGVAQLTVELDARGFQFKPPLNKHGQPYPQQGRRY